MRKLFVLIALIFAKTKLISSENPSCWMFDFNKPSTMDEFEDGIYAYNAPILKSYSDTSITPFRPESTNYLAEKYKGPYGSINSKNKFRINLVTVVMEMALYQEVNSGFDFVDVTVSNLDDRFNTTYLSLEANATTTGWTRAQNNFKQHIPAFMENSEIRITVIVRGSNALAIEYLRFYHPELTDENCVPRQPTTVTTTTTERSTTVPTNETHEPSVTVDTTTVTSTFDTTLTTDFKPTHETQEPSVPVTEDTTTESDTTLTTDQSTTDVVSIENPYCWKFDLNRPSFDLSDFETCNQLYLPAFIIKSYEDSTIISRRKYATHYLTNRWEGMSCMVTSRFISFNESSSIQMGIFLKFAVPGAWVEVFALDGNTGAVETVLKVTDSSNDWRILDGKINKEFANAKIMIQTNMNSYTGFAIDYIDILNTENVECSMKSVVTSHPF